MDNIVVAALIQEGSRVFTEILRLRKSSPNLTELTLDDIGLKRLELENAHEDFLSTPIQYSDPLLEYPASRPPITPTLTDQTPTKEPDKNTNVAVKAQSIEAGCVPCALGHFGTCSGLLNEAVRFADNGMDNVEVIDRLNACLDEFNTMERLDLRPEKIVTLPGWEKDIAQKALKSSRETRHKIEGCRTKDQLLELAASTQTARKKIGQEWFHTKISEFTPEDKEAIAKKVIERLGAMQADGSVIDIPT